MLATKKLSSSLLYILVIAILLIQIYPVVWLMLSSFKSSIELTTQPFAMPSSWSFENYASVFRESSLLLYIKNTAIVTFACLALIIFLSATAGFALVKMINRLNSKLLLFFTIGIMIPIQVTLIPLFIMYKDYGLLNSYPALILPQVGFALPLSILIFTSFYRYVPGELLEAAVIDGCNIYQVFFRIVSPLTINTTITVASINFIFIWNDFVFSNTFTNDKAYKTIAVGLQEFIGAFGATDWGQTFAAISISIIPIIVTYLFLNKYVMAGVSDGAVKG
ncbi:carbohydrate ABC transporter permease [Paenibacillus jilunlii]|uniref:Raffinose/stachyose/melibiose transport system permease protein n=1 Tax=Paenibacillus jilunlii TaxID=682956 RepID=A0A1G9PMJ5_9BACL|nr:carbohydrate ABC transporter permease [Paenibacillus jilunlii]KWX70607.1 sugar ABC transporter permease [Paenibacillus jilunlii]SDM00048.1 raffinose/stachyose/melibiose transport system permease protein [Paenibacillus jilunlii]